jgi:hypothetical protein
VSELSEACLYAAIEAPREGHDCLLRDMIAPLVREIRSHPDLDSFFVVRYPEPVWQVRLRAPGPRQWIHELRLRRARSRAISRDRCDRRRYVWRVRSRDRTLRRPGGDAPR